MDRALGPGDDVTRPLRGFAVLRWSTLVTAVLLLSLPASTPPGFNPVLPGPLGCPGCKTASVRKSGRSGHCPQCGWFLWSVCHQIGQRHYAVSFGGGSWTCALKHRFSTVGMLCPRCWSIGFSKSTESTEWVCMGTEHHIFYVHQDRTCSRCHFTRLVATGTSREWVCAACGQTRPIER